jgi:hypothetical protein
MAVCGGTKRDGGACTLPATAGSPLCWNHDPARAEERKRNASRAANAKHSSVAQELRDVRDLIRELLSILLSDRLPLRVKKELQNIVQLLQCYLRAVELGMRAAEEPLRSDLDVEGLRAQVLARIEELEAREREKEELLAGVTAMAEQHGLDAGALKAVLLSG